MKEAVWIVIVNPSNSVIALLGKTLDIKYNLKSRIPKKHSQGGQSQMRFQRIRKENLDKHFKELSISLEHLVHNLDYPIIIGGNSVNLDYFHSSIKSRKGLKNMIIANYRIAYSGNIGLREIIKKSENILNEIHYNKQTFILKSVFKRFIENSEKYIIGKSASIPYLKSNKYKMGLILSSISLDEPFNTLKSKKLVVIDIESEEKIFLEKTCKGIILQIQ